MPVRLYMHIYYTLNAQIDPLLEESKPMVSYESVCRKLELNTFTGGGLQVQLAKRNAGNHEKQRERKSLRTQSVAIK